MEVELRWGIRRLVLGCAVLGGARAWRQPPLPKTARAMVTVPQSPPSLGGDGESARGSDAAAAAVPVPVPVPAPPRKSYCATVCMVPPSSAADAWDALSKARKELRDPGYFRWPPHANLLYPFLELRSMRKRTGMGLRRDVDGDGDSDSDSDGPGNGGIFDPEMLDALGRAAARCEPFDVTLDTLGTFGGKGRGVLWLYPRSHRRPSSGAAAAAGESSTPSEPATMEDSDVVCDRSEPLIMLQAFLEEEFPTCTDQRKQGRFSPHMTISHFESRDDALEAGKRVKQWWTPQTFRVAEVYVLRRVGDEGQFEIVATVPLGGGYEHEALDGESMAATTDPREQVRVHDPPVRFPLMPAIEEDWVRNERMKLKARRKGGRGRGGNRRRGWRSGSRRRMEQDGDKSDGGDPRGASRSTDTPEEIAAKRAARKAKRERLEAEGVGGVKPSCLE